MTFIRSVVPAFIFFISITAPAFAGDISGTELWEYQMGKGLRIADTDLRLGGYINFKYQDQGGEDGRIILEDLSLFVFGDLSERLKFLSESEVEHFVEGDTNGSLRVKPHAQMERLYFDYLFSDTLKLRAGKFLTPVGIWNEIHAAPLTWTVSRPLVTNAAFPEYATGVRFSGDFGVRDEDLEYSLFLQNNESLDEDTGFRQTHLVYGGRLKWLGRSGLEVGAPFLYYKEYRAGDRVYLTGFDVLYRKKGYEIMGEATYGYVDSAGGNNSKEYGYYLQGVYAVTEKLFLIGRHEYMKARADEGLLRVLTLGGAYKTIPQVVFKIEYQIRSGSLRFDEIDADDSEQLLASFSVLF